MTLRPTSVLLVLVLAACGETQDAPAPSPVVAEPADEPSRSRERAEPPAAPTPPATPAMIDGDLGRWTPSADDLAFAAQLAGDPEVWDAFRQLDRERQIAILRAGLRLKDPIAARRAAFLAEWRTLDPWELDRATKLRIDAILDPQFTDIDGDAPTVLDLWEFGTPEDLTALLRGLATRPADGDRLSGLIDDHKIARGEHVAALAALRPSESWDAKDAVATAWVLLQDADVPDDVVFPLLLGRDDPAYAERFPPGTSAVTLAVEILLRPDRPKLHRVNPPDRQWAWRRLGKATAVASDLEALARLAAVPPRKDDPDVTPLLLLRLGTDGALAVLRNTPRGEISTWSAGWVAARAAIGVEGAREELRLLIFELGDDAALLRGLAALPAETAAQVEEFVLALGDDDRPKLPWNFEAFDPGVPGHVLAHDPALFAGLGARAVERGCPAWVLARLARHVPACRTRTVVEAALARARRPGDLVKYSMGRGSWDIEDLAPYEVVARPALVAWLRQWLRDEDPVVRSLGVSALVRLGDPESAASLVDGVTKTGLSEAEIVAVARSDGPVARKLVEARVREPREPGSDEDRAWITCLAVMHGLPEEVTLLGDVELPPETLPAMRAHVLAGRWQEALLARLDVSPDEMGCQNVGSVRDPRVLDWLRRLRERRSSDRTWWATAELARAGDAAARREHEGAIRAHRYGWCEFLTWRQRCLDDPLAWTPFWIEALAFNCCELNAAQSSFLDDVYEWAPTEDARLWTRADWARAWWARSGGAAGFAYSRLAARWVPKPR